VANHYATLGVERDATRREVVQAYRRLVRRHHPDAGGDPARFLEVQAAYDVLGDARRRADYDLRFAPRPASPPPPPRAAYATSVHRYATAPAPTLPAPSPPLLTVAVGLGLATFLLPAGAAAVVFRAHGSAMTLLFALAAALVCGKACRALADTEAERVRRHRQLWQNGYVLPDLGDREHVARCDRLATIATRCAGFGLAAGFGAVCLLGALAVS
jgi:curved DNA-binding protein CbpA